MMKKRAFIPIEVTHCYNCPRSEFFRCTALGTSVKAAMQAKTIDERCPFLEKKDG